MEAVGDTYAISGSDFTDTGHSESGKPSVAAIVDMMKKIKLPKLPQLPGKAAELGASGSTAKGNEASEAAAAAAAETMAQATAAATLQEVAGIMTHMAKEHLGSLLTHPGHAIVGMYYLAKRHQMIRLADNIDGTHVHDRELVEKLMRYVDISDSIYPDRYPILVQQEQVVKESDILFFYTQVHKLQPGFYIAVDHDNKALMWVIRGTHDIHDLLTDLCGAATPIPGGAAHWGMWRAAGWLLDNHWERVLGYLQQHPGYDLEVIGHSMGAGVGSLLALRLNTEEVFKQQLGGIKVTCMAIATAACLSSELASAVSSYVTTVVMRYDLIPRFSAAQVEALQRELLAIDYKGLLHEDLMEHEVYRTALEHTAAVAEKVKQLAITQAAAATAATAVRAVQSTSSAAAAAAATQVAVVQAKAVAAGGMIQARAVATSGVLARHIEGALAAGAEDGSSAAGPAGAVLQHPKVREVAVRVADALKGTAAGSGAVAAAAVEVPAEAVDTADAPPAVAVAEVATSSSSVTAAATAKIPAASAVLVPPIEAAGEPAGALESFEDTGEAAEVAAAAAAGQFVNVVLYAPGRLLYVRPVDEDVEEDKQRFELVDGKGDQRFKRIVLRTSCMTDHFPAAYKAGLTDVLEQITKRQRLAQEQQHAQGTQQ